MRRTDLPSRASRVRFYFRFSGEWVSAYGPSSIQAQSAVENPGLVRRVTSCVSHFNPAALNGPRSQLGADFSESSECCAELHGLVSNDPPVNPPTGLLMIQNCSSEQLRILRQAASASKGCSCHAASRATLSANKTRSKNGGPQRRGYGLESFQFLPVQRVALSLSKPCYLGCCRQFLRFLRGRPR